jgi:hypothetical protein
MQAGKNTLLVRVDATSPGGFDTIREDARRFLGSMA